LSQWKVSMTQRSSVTMPTGGEATPRRGKGGDDANWTDTDLTKPENKENPPGRFSWYKWTLKI
jgi:hypothetical protein